MKYALSILAILALISLSSEATADDNTVSEKTTLTQENQTNNETRYGIKAEKPTLPENTPSFGVPVATGSRLSKIGLYLLGISLLALGAYKKWGNKQETGNNPIKIVAKRGLGTRTQIILLEVEGNKLLIAQNGEHTEFLTTILSDDASFESSLSEALIDEKAQKVVHG